jgi:hypothetical protein
MKQPELELYCKTSTIKVFLKCPLNQQKKTTRKTNISKLVKCCQYQQTSGDAVMSLTKLPTPN